MKKKLVFVKHLLIPNDLNKYQFNYFKKKGFDIYLVDLAFLIYPDYKNYCSFFKKIFFFKYFCIKELTDWNNLKKEFDYEDTIFWRDFNSINFLTYKISLDISKFRSFKTFNDSYVVDYKKKNLINFKNFFNFDYLRFYLNFSFLFYLNQKKFFFYFLEKFFIKKKPSLIKLNHWDYNNFLLWKKNSKNKQNNLKKKNYCIYLESTQPFYDGDFKLLKLKRYYTKKNFYNNINNLFDEIEKKLNIKVLIALHPKAGVSKNFNFYKNRKIIKNKKMQAFKGCKFVMHRGSTAFSYAVLFNKPSVILIGKEILDNRDIDTINYLNLFKKETGCEIININHKLKKKVFLQKLKINKKKYNLYKDKLVSFKNKTNNSLILNFIDGQIIKNIV